MLWEKCLKVLIAQLKEDEPIPGWTIYVSLAKKKNPKKKIRGTHQASHSAEATSSAWRFQGYYQGSHLHTATEPKKKRDIPQVILQYNLQYNDSKDDLW